MFTRLEDPYGKAADIVAAESHRRSSDAANHSVPGRPKIDAARQGLFVRKLDYFRSPHCTS